MLFLAFISRSPPCEVRSLEVATEPESYSSFAVIADEVAIVDSAFVAIQQSFEHAQQFVVGATISAFP